MPKKKDEPKVKPVLQKSKKKTGVIPTSKPVSPKSKKKAQPKSKPLPVSLPEFDFEEVIYMFRSFSDNNIITSLSKYFLYSYVLITYSEWAYNNHMRDDYFLTQDISDTLNPQSLVKKQLLESKK